MLHTSYTSPSTWSLSGRQGGGVVRGDGGGFNKRCIFGAQQSAANMDWSQKNSWHVCLPMDGPGTRKGVVNMDGAQKKVGMCLCLQWSLVCTWSDLGSVGRCCEHGWVSAESLACASLRMDGPGAPDSHEGNIEEAKRVAREEHRAVFYSGH